MLYEEEKSQQTLFFYTHVDNLIYGKLFGKGSDENSEFNLF